MRLTQTIHLKERVPMTILPIFCDVDDFCKAFLPEWEKFLLSAKPSKRRRKSGLCLSEIMTIVIHFHQSGYRHFKTSYTDYVQKHLATAFPEWVRYWRFIQRMPLSWYCCGRMPKPAVDRVPASPLWILRLYQSVRTAILAQGALEKTRAGDIIVLY